jgi:predicted acyltransferase
MNTTSTHVPTAESPTPPSPAAPRTTGRLVSLDALRGFDMIWILGAEAIVHDLAKSTQAPFFQGLAKQFDHVPWEGFVFYDLIFPLFVFIAGVSLVFSLTKQIQTKGVGVAVRRVIVRAIILYVLGVLAYGGFSKHWADIRLLGVLQRIALCYLFAGLLFCFLRVRGLVAAIVVLLVGYWLLMTYVPVPGVDPPSFAEGKNLANYLDAQYLPLRKWDGDHDPEGLLSTLPAIASCLLGVLAGLFLKKETVRPYQKALCLLIAGGLGVVLGYAWGMQFPVIKKVWTSSFVLVAGGYSAILLGLFYLVLDVWKWRRWAAPFVWIGTNAITLYMLEGIVSFRDLAKLFVGGDLGQLLFHQYANLAVSTVAVLLLVALARFLYVRQIFLRA